MMEKSLKFGTRKYKRAGTCHGIARRDDRKHNQKRHDDFADRFYAVLDAGNNDEEGRQYEEDKTDFSAERISDIIREKTVRSHGGGFSGQISGTISDHPAAYHAVIREYQHGYHRVDPAADRKPFFVAEGTKRADRALAGHPPYRRFRYDHGVTEGQHQYQVHQQEYSASVLRGKIREAPDIAQSDRRACHSENIPDIAGEGCLLFGGFFYFSGNDIFLIHGCLRFSSYRPRRNRSLFGWQ